MAELHAGDVLGGVRIDAVAGRGGMGIVYRGTELGLKRTVAIKLVRGDLAGNAEFRARFTRESEIAASLDHAHVIPVFAAGEDQGRLYVTMRYVDGTDLREEINRRGRLDPYFAATVISQIASALDAAHRRGLVHRDVKPANILLADSDGRPHAYLTDFGVSRAAQSDGLTQAGAMVGTDDYMAPEQFENKGVDGRSDVYALGCVLYETLTGHVPFQRDSMAAKLYAHLRQPPPDLPAHLPTELNRVIRRAMAKSPGERYATAGEMGRDVLDAVTGAGDSWTGRTTSRVELPTVQRPVAPHRQGPPSYPGVQHPGAPSHPGALSHPGSPSQPGIRPPGVPTYAGSGQPSHPGGPPSHPGAGHPGPPQPLYASGPLTRPPGPPSYPPGSGTGPPKNNKTGLIIALIAVVVVVAAGVGGWLLLRDDGPAPVTPGSQAFGTVDGDPIKVGANPNDIIEAGGFLWTANMDDGTVTKIDPATGDTEEISVGGDPIQLAATRGAVWALNYTDAVTHIDIDTGEVSEPIQAGPMPDVKGIAAGDGQVWLSHITDNTVTRIDASSMSILG
ncbi:MAG: protein kinase, partial [Mycobacterium sp.]